MLSVVSWSANVYCFQHLRLCKEIETPDQKHFPFPRMTELNGLHAAVSSGLGGSDFVLEGTGQNLEAVQ